MWPAGRYLLTPGLDNRLTDGGKVISPTHQPHFTPQKHYYFYVSRPTHQPHFTPQKHYYFYVSGTHFC
jgi:hypothetical protein